MWSSHESSLGNESVLATQTMRRGFVTSFTRERYLSARAVGLVPTGAPLTVPYLSLGAPVEVRHFVASFEVTGTDWVSVPLTAGLGVPLSLSGVGGQRPSDRQQWSPPPVTPFSRMDKLYSGRVMRENFSPLPLLPS